MVWSRLDAASMEGAACGAAPAFAFLDPGRFLSSTMIILLHPRSARPKNGRFPLSLLALGAVLEGKADYEIGDRSTHRHRAATIVQIARREGLETRGGSVFR